MKLGLLLVLIFPYLFADTSKQNSQVLIINSFHKGFQWSDELINGVEEVLKNHRNTEN